MYKTNRAMYKLLEIMIYETKKAVALHNQIKRIWEPKKRATHSDFIVLKITFGKLHLENGSVSAI